MADQIEVDVLRRAWRDEAASVDLTTATTTMLEWADSAFAGLEDFGPELVGPTLQRVAEHLLLQAGRGPAPLHGMRRLAQGALAASSRARCLRSRDGSPFGFDLALQAAACAAVSAPT